MGRYYYGGWAPYVPVAERRRQAARKAAALGKKGKACQPVTIEGRTIARSFWGKAWCDNLEGYSDFANRLPRGRSYLRNGAVIDLRIETGKVSALVMGSSLYQVKIGVRPVESTPWQKILKECAGQIASLVELLQGRLSQAVMQVVTRPAAGLFPTPRQIRFNCSCPDGAYMCKHVAAALYGVGTRLDSQPDLLFRLRHVDAQDLITHAGALPMPDAHAALGEHQRLESANLSSLFGVELDQEPVKQSSLAALPPKRGAGTKQRTAKRVFREPSGHRRRLLPKAARAQQTAAKPTPVAKKPAVRQVAGKTITTTKATAKRN